MLGGILTERVRWRWIFFVNIPVSLVTIALSLTKFANIKFGKNQIDLLGVVTLSIAAGAVPFGITYGGKHGWTDATTIGAFIASIMGLIAFIVAEAKSKTR